MNTDPVPVARACYQAYVAKDRAAIERLISSDFHFTSPMDNRIDRETYMAICWQNSQNIKEFELVHLVPDGERVFVTYQGVRNGGTRFRNTEILTVRGGRIVDVEVYFGWNVPHSVPEGRHRDSITPSGEP